MPMHKALQRDEVVNHRYHIIDVLGHGGNSITYAAKDLNSKRYVALKELSLRGLSDWKQLELFQREAQILGSLNHPAIPCYINHFEIDTPDNRYFYLVQELAQGLSLAQRVAKGERFSEAAIYPIAIQVLKILQYLHSLTPPVIHRDIKPENIVYRDDGQIFLVDFGAVQAVYRDINTFGSTIVGTFGYMAPEQFRGQAYPSTDLYGLGTTLLHLLTHQHPNNLPQKRMKLEIHKVTNLSAQFTDWLEGLLEPLVEERFHSANDALWALENLMNTQQLAMYQQTIIPPHTMQFPPRDTQIQSAITAPAKRLLSNFMGSSLITIAWYSMCVLITVTLIGAGIPVFLVIALTPFAIFGLRLLRHLF